MADTVGFVVLPRRWGVERTLAWLNRNRRLAKDFEASTASAQTWVYVASAQLLPGVSRAQHSIYPIKIRTLCGKRCCHLLGFSKPRHADIQRAECPTKRGVE